LRIHDANKHNPLFYFDKNTCDDAAQGFFHFLILKEFHAPSLIIRSVFVGRCTDCLWWQ
jgi:hypothetical protein